MIDVGIAEPSTAPRATNCGRVVARLVVRRHGLTKALQVCAFWFFIFHQETSDRVALVIFLDIEITKATLISLVRLLAPLPTLPAAFRAA